MTIQFLSLEVPLSTPMFVACPVNSHFAVFILAFAIASESLALPSAQDALRHTLRRLFGGRKSWGNNPLAEFDRLAALVDSRLRSEFGNSLHRDIQVSVDVFLGGDDVTDTK